MRKPVKSLRMVHKLLVSYLAACLIPLIASSMLLYRISVRSLEETTLEFSRNFSSQIISDLDDFIEEYDQLTRSVLVDNDIFSRLDSTEEESISVQVENKLAVRKMTTRLKTLRPDIKMIMLMTDDKLLYSYGNQGEEVDRETLMGAAWLQSIRNSSETMSITAAHSCTHYDRNQDAIVITVGRKLLSAQGGYKGLLLIDIDPASVISLNESFLTARNKYDIQICVTNADDEILYDSDIARGKVSWNERRTQNILPEAEENYIILTDQTEHSGLKVYTIIPKKNLLFQITHITTVTKVTVIICMVLILFLSVILSRAITRPLARLQDRMKQMESGQYRVLEMKSPDDEIGQLVISYNRMVVTIKNLIEQVYLSEIKQKNAKFLALQTQINPHMLFNTLESIRMKALMNSDDKVAEMIKLLAKMFRAALYDTPDTHKVRDEIEYSKSYIKLQNMKFRDCFFLDVDVEDCILDVRMISLVFQPVIENCIEHGHKAGDQPMHIRLEGRVYGGERVLFRIEDDGIGMLPEQKERMARELEQIGMEMQPERKEEHRQEESRKSIGLKNIAERIKLHYGKEYYLKLLWSSEGGTCIEICIPLHGDKEKGEEKG